MQVESDKQYN